MLKVFSFGGGAQSTAALVLAAQGRLDYCTFLFANVGSDSENPDTLDYVHEVAFPFATRHGLTLHELQRHKRDGSVETIYGRITRTDSRSIGIPVYMASGAPGTRQCTYDFKIAVCDKWLKEHGACVEGATVGLGISLDEWSRMRNDSGVAWKKLDYPLIDLRLTRVQCAKIIQQADLPVPPKSSCWFCPYHSTRAWQDLRNTHPHLFEKAVQLETLMNERRAKLGKDRVWLSSKLKPLTQVTTDLIQLSLPEYEEMCESGYCFV